MSIIRRMTVVFRVAAGPRLGFGHLARCRALAAALGVAPRVSIRGSLATRRAAARMGLRVVPGGRRALDRMRPQLVVVDDPSPRHAAAWVRAARQRGSCVAAIHDAGIGRVEADLAIDGSVLALGTRGPVDLAGPRFAVIDPRIAALCPRRRRAGTEAICVAVGGGAHVFSLVPPVVAELARIAPGADIRVAPGFTARGRRPALPSGRWMTPGGLPRALASAHLAVVAGGLTVYEACALGVPAVAVSVVPAQRPTIEALARRGVVIDGGALDRAGAARHVGARVAALLAAPAERRRLSVSGRRLVDGRGAARIATALVRLVQTGGARA